MKWLEWYDRNILSFLGASATAYHLYTNQINLALWLIGILDFIDLLAGCGADFWIHHLVNFLGWFYWNTLSCNERALVEPAIWYLLLHELSTIPYTLIYILKPVRGYKKYMELPLKLWFAASFLLVRSYSLYKTYYSIVAFHTIFYSVLAVLGVLDVYWGSQIIVKVWKTINLNTCNKLQNG